MRSMSKSYVGMGFQQCPVCGVEHDEVVLLNKRLRNTLKQRQCVGHDMCPEHQKLKDDGFIAIVIVTGSPPNMLRTGDIAHARASAWPNMFSAPVPKHGICYAPPEVLELLKTASEG